MRPPRRRPGAGGLSRRWSGFAVSLLALRRPALRPAYWSLLTAIPFAAGGQLLLLDRHLLFRDLP